MSENGLPRRINIHIIYVLRRPKKCLGRHRKVLRRHSNTIVLRNRRKLYYILEMY